MPQGIPDSSNYGDLGQLSEGSIVDLFRQQHTADRAGEHEDFRLGTPETGLFSWALRKGLPEPGKKHLAVRQPIHEHSYGSFEGEIPEGYGKGSVKNKQTGRLLITKVTPDRVEFTSADERYPSRYTLLKPGKWKGEDWLLINNTRMAKEKPEYQKIHYKVIPANQVEQVFAKLGPGSSVAAKIDGASSLIELLKHNVEILSYRESKKTGAPITHSERVFGGRPTTDVPQELVGSVLRGELHGVKGQNEKVIPPQELGGLLNSTVENSLNTQKAKDIKLRDAVFDIQQYGKQPIDFKSVPYEQRRAMIDKVMAHLDPSVFVRPDEAHTPEEALQLWKAIKAGRNKQTREGVVINNPLDKPSKAKLVDDHDVYIKSIFPGQKKYTNVGAGGFGYSLDADSPEVGRVGTGLTDALRKELHTSPMDYIGRMARIRSQGQFDSGAYRGPSLLAIRED